MARTPLAVKVTIKDVDERWQEIQRRILARPRFVDIGVHSALEGEHVVKYATANEFGATINVPGGQPFIILDQSKIRGRGMHKASIPLPDGRAMLFLKKGKRGMGVTKPHTITIPPRPFIRSTVDENLDFWRHHTRRLWGMVLAGRITKFEGLSLLGQEVQRRIQRKIRTLRHPPNSPITIWKKGSSNPLNDTGRLVNSIRYVVKET